jgi:general secretion pathway protein D
MSVTRSIALLLLGLASVFGQAPGPVAPPGVPVPGVVPPAPAGAPAANQPAPNPGVPLGQTKIIADINEPKLTGNALSGLYRTYTGRRVIVSAAASVAEFSFVQEATPQDPLTFAEAAELLKKAATIEGFVFVPDAENPNLDILTHTSGIRPTNRGVSVYNENDTLPEGDAVISYVMTLSYIKPAEAVNTFTQIIGQFGAYGSIAAVANASAVVITENTSLIRKLIDLKKEIDKPGSVQGTRFIKVQFADVTEIAETLTALLTAQQSTQKTAGIQRADAAPAAPTAPPGVIPQTGGSSAGGAGEDTPVQIIPDPRTNRIFVMGRPVDLLFVEGLVREFDVETSEKNFLRRKLRFLTVSDFLPIAGDALTRAFSGTGDSGGSGGGASGGAQSGGSRAQSTGGQTSSSSRSSGSRSGSSRSNSTGANFGGSSSGGSFGGSGSSGGFGGGGGGGSGGGGLGDPSVSAAPESVLVGRTLLVADNITNSIVVQGPPSGLEIIERLLDQIDVKPDQVMISTVIGQLALNDTKESGIGYLFRSNEFTTGGGGGIPIIPIIDNIKDGLTSEDITDLGLTSSGLRAYGTVGDLSIFVKALQSKSDFTVLSRPSIFTSNNQKGTISSGERIATPTQGGTSGGNYNSGTSIEYQDVVLKLEVIPLVNSDNEITMQIALLNDEVQKNSQVIEGAGTDGGNLTVPRITTREIVTTATVPNGQTIVLGGLIVGRNDQAKSGIPILSDIPYLGRLFSSTENTDDRSELMVFIQPSIVKNDRSLDAVQADMDNRYKVSGKAREFADGPGVLPPVDAIPVPDKTGTSVAEPKESATSTMKPSIRPAFRR